MKRAATSTIAVVLVLVLVVVGVIAVVGLATDGAPAVEVGDRTVSRESVNDELRAIADNQDLADGVGAQNVSATRGSIVSEAGTGLVLTGVLHEQLMKEYLDRKGERITAADRAEGADIFGGTIYGQFADGFPKWYVDRGKERLAAYVAFSRVTGIDMNSDTAIDEIAAELKPTARRVGVKVDPRYGEIRPKILIVGPYRLPAGLLPSSSADASD